MMCDTLAVSNVLLFLIIRAGDLYIFKRKIGLQFLINEFDRQQVATYIACCLLVCPVESRWVELLANPNVIKNVYISWETYDLS